MTFNNARTYAQLLSRSCNTCNKDLKYILDSVSKFNGCYIGRDDIERSDSSIILLFCTQLTFDLIMSPRDVSRLGIRPFRVYYTYINIISMDAGFYSIWPSKVKNSLFCLNGQPTITHWDETEQRTLDSQIVRAKENLKLSHDGPSQRQA